MFVTEVDPITGQSIHDELVALLIEYLDETAKNKDSFKFLNVSQLITYTYMYMYMCSMSVHHHFIIVIILCVYIVCVFLSGHYSQEYGSISWSNWKRKCKQ